MWGASGRWMVKRERVDVGGDFCVYLWELCGSGVTDETKESKLITTWLLSAASPSPHSIPANPRSRPQTPTC